MMFENGVLSFYGGQTASAGATIFELHQAQISTKKIGKIYYDGRLQGQEEKDFSLPLGVKMIYYDNESVHHDYESHQSSNKLFYLFSG